MIGWNTNRIEQGVMSVTSDFINLIKKHEGMLYKLSRAYADSREDRQDLYQEMVYQLWKSFQSFKGKSQFSTWMYRVALNTAIAHLNKQKKQGQRLDSDGVFKKLFDEQDAVMDQRVAFLYHQIKQLKQVDRGIILLLLEGKSYEEIARITGFSKTNIGTRINRIKTQFKANKPKN